MGLPRIALEELVNANVIACSKECVVNSRNRYRTGESTVKYAQCRLDVYGRKMWSYSDKIREIMM